VNVINHNFWERHGKWQYLKFRAIVAFFPKIKISIFNALDVFLAKSDFSHQLIANTFVEIFNQFCYSCVIGFVIVNSYGFQIAIFELPKIGA